MRELVINCSNCSHCKITIPTKKPTNKEVEEIWLRQGENDLPPKEWLSEAEIKLLLTEILLEAGKNIRCDMRYWEKEDGSEKTYKNLRYFNKGIKFIENRNCLDFNDMDLP